MRFHSDFRDEYQKLMSAAGKRIVAHKHGEKGYRRLLQLRAFPSYPGLPVPYTYALLGSRDEAQASYLAVACRWDHAADEKKLATPIERRLHPKVLRPTILRTRIELPAERGRALQSALETVSMLLLPKRPHWGLDGTTYEAAVGEGETTCTFLWWATPPDEWQPLGDIIDELQRLAHPTELSPDTDDER